MWRGVVSIFLVMIFFMCVVPEVVHAAGDVIYVDSAATGDGDGSSWTNAYNYLQDALAAAKEIAKPIEIRVAQGLYRPDQGAGRVEGDIEAAFQMFDGVILEGGYAGIAGSDPNARNVELYETVLDGNMGSASSNHVVTGSFTGATASIDGFSITNGTEAIMIYAGKPIIQSVTFKNNDTGLGVYGASPSLTDCTFIENFEAIFAFDCNSTVTHCHFEANRTGTHFWSGDPVLTDCTFTGHET